MRRINPISAEADDIVRVVRRLEDAIRALHQVADLLPLLLANRDAEDEADEAPRAVQSQPRDSQDPSRDGRQENQQPSGKEVDHADTTGGPDQIDPRPGE